MKNDKNILDNYLKEKVEETHFDLQDSHWQHALAALDAKDEEPKKTFPWWRTLAITGLLLLAGLAYTIYNQPAKNTITIANIPTDEIVKPTTTLNNSQPNNDVVTNNETNNNIEISNDKPNNIGSSNDVTSSNNTVKDISNTDISNQTNTNPKPIYTKVAPKQIANDFSSSADGSIIKSIKKNKKTNIVITSTSAIKNTDSAIATTTNTDITEIATAPIQPISINNKIVNASKKIVNSIKKITAKKTIAKLNATQKTESKIESKSEQATAKPIVQTVKIKSTKNKITKPVKNKATVKQENIAVSKPISKIIDNIIEPKQAITTPPEPITKRNPKYLGDLNNYKQVISTESWTNPKGKPTIIVVDKQTQPDTITKLTTNDATPAKQKWQATKSTKSFTTTAQVSVAASPKANSGANNWQPSPYLGFGYLLPINNKLDVHLQIGGTYMGGLNYNYTAINYRFGFGVDSSLFSLQHKTLYQLCVPLTINYKLSLRQSIFGGVGANFGLDVLSKVKTFTAASASHQWGYNNGYTSFAPFMQIGYQYQVAKHIFVNGMWQQGLVDVTNNAQLGNSSVDRNSKATIGVTYKWK